MATRKKAVESPAKEQPVAKKLTVAERMPAHLREEPAPKKPRKKKLAPKRPVGRPGLFTEALGEEICERLGNGERLTKICKDEHMPKFGTVWKWANDTEEVNGVHNYKYPNFARNFIRARVSCAEYGVMEAGDLVDEAGQPMLHPHTGEPMLDKDGNVVKVLSHEAIAHARSQANFRQWVAERVASKVYGQKQTIENTGPNGGPIQTMNANANANFDRAELQNAFKDLLDKGI